MESTYFLAGVTALVIGGLPVLPPFRGTPWWVAIRFANGRHSIEWRLRVG